MPKYTHPNLKDMKHYYVGSNGFTYYVKEYRNKVCTTTLELSTIEEFKRFIERLETNGWTNADAS